MADCRHYEELMSAELDGTLTEAQRAELEDHVAGCPSCRELREAMRLAVHGLNDAVVEAPPELLKGIRFQMGLGRKRFGIHAKEWRFTALAAVICIVVFGVTRYYPMYTELRGSGSAKESAGYAESASYAVSAPRAVSAPEADAETTETAAAANMEDRTENGPAPGGMKSKSFAYAVDAAEGEEEAPAEAEPQAPAEPAPAAEFAQPAQKFFYEADSQPGYGAYRAVPDKENWYGVYILYGSLPEFISGSDSCVRLERDGEEQWKIPLSFCRRLEDECLADEIYYGDLMKTEGLVIVLKTGVNENGND